MFDGDLNSSYFEASRSAFVSASPKEVREVTTAFARDVGWGHVASEGALLSFHLSQSLIWGGVDAEVSIRAAGARTVVQFLVRTNRGYSSLQTDVDRAAETLANGVLQELVYQGATVDPSSLAVARQNRQRLSAIERLRTRAQWVLLGLIPPVVLMLWFVTENFFYVLAGVTWLLSLVIGGQFVRLLVVGMRARVQMVVVLLPMICAAIVFTLIGALVGAGVVQVVFSGQ